MALMDYINLIFRDHVGYTGDGQGGNGAVPVGDRSTYRKSIDNLDLRQAFKLIEEAIRDGVDLNLQHGMLGLLEGQAPSVGVPILHDLTTVGGQVYGRAPVDYAPTHERQFVDANGQKWVDRRFLLGTTGMSLIVLVTGQSNSLGVSGGNGGNIASQPGVWSYERHPTGSQTTGWKLGFKLSPDFPTGQTGNHYGYHFCARLARETGRPVCMVPYSIGGMDVAEWLPNGGGLTGATGTMWTNLISAWQQALTVALPFRNDGKTLTDLGLTRADYVLWHQGEENRDATATYPSGHQGRQFKRDLIRVFNAFLNPASASSPAAPLIRASTPIIMGDLAYGGTDGADQRNAELYQVAAEISGVNLALIGDIPTSDGIHFSPDHIERIADYCYDQIGPGPSLTGWDVTIAAGGLYEWRPSHAAGAYNITESNGSSRLHFDFGYRVTSAGGQITTIAALPGTWQTQLLDNVDLTTLANTTSGNIGISALSGRIQFRNRRSAALTIRITPLTRAPLPAYGAAE